MNPEQRLLLAVSDILRGSYPHLNELHQAVEMRVLSADLMQRTADILNKPAADQADQADQADAGAGD